jgi:poly(ribitol-phosphate) beta-N-acetylglucosaminyltransferase
VAARVVSILADYVCYFYARRSDGSNAGSARIEPPGYYANVREVMAVVTANVAPGELQDRLLRRFCRAEMLSRVSEPSFHKRDPALRASLFSSISELVHDTVTPGVEEGLGVVPRLRLRLLREGRIDDLAALAERLDTVSAVAELRTAGWHEGRLELAFRGHFRIGVDNARNLVLDDGVRCYVDPAITDGIVAAPMDVTSSIGSIRVDAILRDPATGEEWPAATRSTVKRTPGAGEAPGSAFPAVDATASIDPARVASKRPLPRGTWDVSIRLSWLGFERRTLLHAGAESPAAVRPAILGGTIVVPYVGDDGALRLDVDGATRTLASAIDPEAVSRPPSDGRTIRVHLPIASTRETGRRPVAVVIGPIPGARQEQLIAGDLEATRDGMLLTAAIDRRIAVGAGRHPLGVRLDGLDGPVVPIGAAIAVAPPQARDARIYLEGTRRIGAVEGAVRLAAVQTSAPARRVAALPSRAVRSAAHWERARRLVERMPEPVQRLARRMYGIARRRGFRTP